MKKVTVIGHFGAEKVFLDGQTVKTKILAEELENHFGKNQIDKIDTYGGKKALIKLFFKSISALRKSEQVIILPAHNGVRFFVPLLSFFNRFYKRKLFYVVVGGWLPQYLQDKKSLSRKLKKFDCIFVETSSMKTALEEQGFENVVVMPNCKRLQVLKEEELVYPSGEPYKLCTFSRVMKEKGIEDAVNAVIAVNEKLGRIVYTLDIYGQVDDKQIDWFDNLQKQFPEYIKYGGLVPFDKSVEVLKNYFALLFPTRFYTEGIPGTIIDAYAAGVPVISSYWENYSDICIDNATAIGYAIGEEHQLEKILFDALNDLSKWVEMKKLCLKASGKYTPQEVMNILIQNLGD